MAWERRWSVGFVFRAGQQAVKAKGLDLNGKK